MTKKEFREYESPVVEVIEVEVEKGFATSAQVEAASWEEEEW